MSCSITLTNLTIFQNKKPLIKNLNLNLSHKQKLAIIGDNGCGKTTLLRTIIGLHQEYRGEIEILHKSIKNKKEFKKMRKIVGFLPQDSDEFFISPTVVEDVAFSLLCRGIKDKEAFISATRTLERLGVSHLASRSVFELSGGEKKIVALAGILVFEPEILLLDEPTNGLDVTSVDRVIEILKSIDKSMLIVSHDASFITDIAHNTCRLNS